MWMIHRYKAAIHHSHSDHCKSPLWSATLYTRIPICIRHSSMWSSSIYEHCSVPSYQFFTSTRRTYLLWSICKVTPSSLNTTTSTTTISYNNSNHNIIAAGPNYHRIDLMMYHCSLIFYANLAVPGCYLKTFYLYLKVNKGWVVERQE